MNCSAHISNGIGEVSSTTPPWKWCGRVTEVAIYPGMASSNLKAINCWYLAINRENKVPLDSQEEAEAIYRILSKGIV